MELTVIGLVTAGVSGLANVTPKFLDYLTGKGERHGTLVEQALRREERMEVHIEEMRDRIERLMDELEAAKTAQGDLMHERIDLWDQIAKAAEERDDLKRRLDEHEDACPGVAERRSQVQ